MTPCFLSTVILSLFVNLKLELVSASVYQALKFKVNLNQIGKYQRITREKVNIFNENLTIFFVQFCTLFMFLLSYFYKVNDLHQVFTVLTTIAVVTLSTDKPRHIKSMTGP